MAYATQTDITSRYSMTELLISADRDNNGTLDAGIVAQALDDATSEIDAYLSARVQVPLLVVPDFIKRICVDIAVYRMSENAASLTDEKRRRFDDAILMLSKASSGDVMIPGTNTSDASPNSVEFSTSRKDWTRSKSKGMF